MIRLFIFLGLLAFIVNAGSFLDCQNVSINSGWMKSFSSATFNLSSLYRDHYDDAMNYSCDLGTFYVNFCGGGTICGFDSSVCLSNDLGLFSLGSTDDIKYGPGDPSKADGDSVSVASSYGVSDSTVFVNCDPDAGEGYIYHAEVYYDDYTLYIYSAAGCGTRTFTTVGTVGLVFTTYFLVVFFAVLLLTLIMCIKRKRSSKIGRVSINYTLSGWSLAGWFFWVFPPAIGSSVALLFIPELGSIWGSIAGLFYLSGVIFCCCAPEFRALRNKMNGADLENHIRVMRGSLIDLHFDLEAYHYDQVVTRYNDGRETVEQNLVVSHRESIPVTVPYFADLTMPVVIPSSTSFIRMQCSYFIQWLHDSSQRIETMRSSLYERNCHLDDNVTVKTVIKIPGFRENILVTTPGNKPSILGKIFTSAVLSYFLSFIGLSALHSLLLSLRIPTVTHTLFKMASMAAPVIDDEFLRRYNLPLTTDSSNNVLFVNPMPLYVPLETAIKCESSAPVNPTAPPVLYMHPETATTTSNDAPGPDIATPLLGPK